MNYKSKSYNKYKACVYGYLQYVMYSIYILKATEKKHSDYTQRLWVCII